MKAGALICLLITQGSVHIRSSVLLLFKKVGISMTHNDDDYPQLGPKKSKSSRAYAMQLKRTM